MWVSESSGASPLIGLTINRHTHGISVVGTLLLKSVILVIEPLPLFTRVSNVFCFSEVELSDFLEMILHKVKVITNLPLYFSSVEHHYELWFDSCVEVKLNFWKSVAVDFNVSELIVLSAELVVISLDLLADWVPCSMEVNACECWSIFIKVLDNIV